jgi:predicted GNAT superfamily acetyltransferase
MSVQQPSSKEESTEEQPADQALTEQPQPVIRIAALHDLALFQSCVDLQVAVWGYSDGDLIPRRMFLLADRIGGQVLGAFDGETIVGFAMALPGYRNGRPYLHSHMLAVLPEYRDLGLGRRLKLAQRDDAVARGFELMEWTFDPLEIKNAHLNIARLGAICRRYQPDFYGPSSSPLQGGLPTDRLYAEWWLRSPRVRRILGEAASEGAAQGISEEVVVPHELYQWKQEAATRELASDRQRSNREALQSAFARGLAVVGYRRESNGDGHFLLGPIDPVEIAPAATGSLP